MRHEQSSPLLTAPMGKCETRERFLLIKIFAFSQSASALSIRYGTHKRSSSSYADIKVQKIVQHPSYDPNTIQNDISLLILAKEVKPTDNVKFVAIEEQDLDENTDVNVYGWGLTDGTGSTLPENLQKGTLKVLSNENCQKIWGDVNGITDTMICALDSEGKTQQACNVSDNLLNHQFA